MPNENGREYKTLLTAIGKNKIAAAVQGGGKVNITQAAVGDGGGNYYTPTADMTALIREVWRGDIAGKWINQKSANMVDVKVILPADVGGFTVREAALFDEYGNMIAICNIPDTEKAVITTGAAGTLTIVMHIVLTDADVVEFTIDPLLDVVTAADLEIALENFRNSIVSDIVIPASGWTQQENNVQLSDDYGYYIDIQVAAATSEQFPSVSLHKSSLEIASKAGLCPTVQALDGKIRFWVRNIPTEDMNATVALFIKSGSNNSASGGNTYKLPVATAEKLGGVKIGDGINVTEDGTISSSGKVDPSNISTKEEVTEMLDEIFKETD